MDASETIINMFVRLFNLSAAYVARRALLKTPSRRRPDVTAESPLATPSRALQPPVAAITPPSTRRSARNASTAKKMSGAQEVQDVQPRGRGRSAKSAGDEEEKKAGNKGRGNAVQGLDKQLEKVSIKGWLLHHN